MRKPSGKSTSVSRQGKFRVKVKVVDLNVLLYVINADAQHHRSARRWWENAINADEPVALTWIVIIGFLRISTSRRVYPNPLTADEALTHTKRWLDLPTITILQESKDHMIMLDQLIRNCGTAGNLTTDAHLACMAINHGATLVSYDRDFLRFPNLRWECPEPGD